MMVVGGGLGVQFWLTHRSVALSVGAHPTIRDPTACVGTAVIQAGPANQVTFTGNIPSYTQNSSTNTIDIGGDFCQDNNITGPPGANLYFLGPEKITNHGGSRVINF